MCSEVPKFSLSAEGGGPPITISAGNAKLRRQILSLTASISAMQFSFHKSAPGHKICYASNLVGRLTQVTFFLGDLVSPTPPLLLRAPSAHRWGLGLY